MGGNVIGLDIGHSAVRAVELSTDGTYVSSASQVLPADAVVGGQLRNPAAVTAAVSELWSAKKRFSHKNVKLSVSNSSVIIRLADQLEWVPGEAMRKTLPFQVKDHLPVPVEETYLDFYPVSETAPNGNGARTAEVLLVAAKRDMVNGFTDAVAAAGVKPLAVDISPLAVLRANLTNVQRDGNAEVVVHIGADVVNVIVHRGGVPVYVRVLPSSGSRHISESIAAALNVSVADAEQLKISTGLTAAVPAPVGAGDGYSAGSTEGIVAGVVDSKASALINEVRTSLDFIRSHHVSVPAPTAVVLAGGGARLNGLGQRMASELQLPVSFLDMSASVAGLPQPTSAVDVDWSTAVGIALGGTR